MVRDFVLCFGKWLIWGFVIHSSKEALSRTKNSYYVYHKILYMSF